MHGEFSGEKLFGLPKLPLAGGEAQGLVGADHLLPGMQADTLITDIAFDADERVVQPLAAIIWLNGAGHDARLVRGAIAQTLLSGGA